MKKRSKYSAFPWRLHLLVGIVGVIVIGIVIYGFYVGERLNRLDEPLIDAVMEIQLEAGTADIWFKEVIKGNMNTDLKTIWEPLDQSVWYLSAILKDSKIRNNFLRPLEDIKTLQQIGSVQQKLAELKEITALITAAMETSELARGHQLRYKKLYTEFLDHLHQLEGRLLEIKARSLTHFRYIHRILIVSCIALFLSIGFAFQFFVRQRTKDYQALRETMQKLEVEIAERTRAETELQKAQVELEDRVFRRTEELSVANTKLKEEIAGRIRIEKQLQQSQSMLQGVFDGISDPLILVDRNMVLRMINKSAAAYYNVKKYQEAIGKRCYKAVGKSVLCEGCRIPEAVLNGREMMLERKGFMNPERLEQVTIYPAEGKDGSSGDAIVRVNDITETRLFERHLVQSEKMASLGILVSSVAHEINNPNNWISFNIPILKDYIEQLVPIVDEFAAKCPDMEFCHMSYPEFRQDIYKLMDNIENGAGRISSFVANLREFSHSSGERKKKYVDLASVIEKVDVICRNKLKRSVRSFEIDFPKDLPHIHIDPFGLEQILINILMNAAQAADKNDSWVKLSATTGNTWQEFIIVEISDNGCGIDKKSKSHIFDPFFTTKPPGDGTGLGLYICHNLIQELGGRIDVASEPGVGSTFRVFLPDIDRRSQPRGEPSEGLRPVEV